MALRAIEHMHAPEQTRHAALYQRAEQTGLLTPEELGLPIDAMTATPLAPDPVFAQGMVDFYTALRDPDTLKLIMNNPAMELILRHDVYRKIMEEIGLSTFGELMRTDAIVYGVTDGVAQTAIAEHESRCGGMHMFGNMARMLLENPDEPALNHTLLCELLKRKGADTLGFLHFGELRADGGYEHTYHQFCRTMEQFFPDLTARNIDINRIEIRQGIPYYDGVSMEGMVLHSLHDLAYAHVVDHPENKVAQCLLDGSIRFLNGTPMPWGKALNTFMPNILRRRGYDETTIAAICPDTIMVTDPRLLQMDPQMLRAHYLRKHAGGLSGGGNGVKSISALTNEQLQAHIVDLAKNDPFSVFQQLVPPCQITNLDYHSSKGPGTHPAVHAVQRQCFADVDGTIEAYSLCSQVGGNVFSPADHGIVVHVEDGAVAGLLHPPDL